MCSHLAQPERAALIVGIAGGTASGKSTLARAVADLLAGQVPPVRSEVIGMDKYFRSADPDAPTLRFSLAPDEPSFDFNHPDSTDNAALAADLRRLAAPGSSNAPRVIVVEGLMIFAIPELRALCGLRVYVDLEDDLRLARRILRDMTSTRRYTKPEEIVRYYLESARRGHKRHVEPSRQYADLVIRGDADFIRAAGLVCGAIAGLRHSAATSGDAFGQTDIE